MLVNHPAINLSPPSKTPSAIRSWVVGQILDAAVVGRDSENSIRLRVADETVRAATALPLRRGANLKLKVTQLKPIVVLTPLEVSQAPAKNLIRAAISRTLPVQRPIGVLLDELDSALKPSLATTRDSTAVAVLPPVVARAAQNVLKAIPSLSEIRDPRRLPLLIRRLGVFFESAVQHNLANHQVPLPKQDLKWELLRLRGAIRDTINRAAPKISLSDPPARQNSATPKPEVDNNSLSETTPLRKLEQFVDGAIAKIETNQLKAVSSLINGDFEVALDLPIPFEDGHRVVQIKISRDNNHQTDELAETTTIVLQIPVHKNAELQAVVTLHADNLSVKLWSIDETVRNSISQMRGPLIDRLTANGLENVTVTIVEIKPFDEWDHKFDQLVDVTA
jgi:hypothetical protein